MQKLTSRGMNLSIVFENINLPVIESYPGAAQDILRFPRKRINLKELEIDLLNMGIKPYSQKEIITHDEIDALTSALVGYFYLAGMYEAIGDIDEGYLIIPDLRKEIKQVGPIWT
jgi:predicted nuclease with RNAse H fold